ncbi:MAG: large conductance mechanosensitive channel protein MscL [Agathobaculum sp.]|uniref:large conductance mechanosensitive channel protein MscL n=1 Tax=Agathobaculum sp. TaxID=2048138 RepID=UPI003D8EBA3C
MFALKKFIEEFKAFALRGNVMDMAIGVIIGGAFSGIVGSLTENLINPILGAAGQTDLSAFTLNIGNIELRYGAFLTSVINFIILALILFCMVKAVNKLASRGKKAEAPAAPTTKKCPYCLSEIPLGATKCAHCASELPEE